MALKVKYTDDHGILHINMSPSSSASPRPSDKGDTTDKCDSTDITDPKFDTINNRFGQYDLFGGKYDDDSSGEHHSLFRSRFNSIEDELARTPYAFTTERSLRHNTPLLDITIKSTTSPSQDIEDDRFFNHKIDYDLFGPDIEKSDDDSTPAFTITQLIHAQDRYYDLSSRQSLYESPKTSVTQKVTGTVKDTKKVVEKSKSQINIKLSDKKVRSDNSEVRSVPASARVRVGLKADDAFTVLNAPLIKTQATRERSPVVPISKRKKEKSFAIITDSPSRPTSPHSLPVDIRARERISPFRGRGFREETSRHTTPRTSAANSRASSPLRRRTSSLSRLDNMATATLPPPIPPLLTRPHSPRNFLKENIEEVREMSELNRELHEAEAEKKKKEEEEALLKEMAAFESANKNDAIRSVVCSRTNSRSNSPGKIRLRSRSNSPSAIAPTTMIQFENIPDENEAYINTEDGMPKPAPRKSRVRSMSRSQPQSNDGSPKHSKIPKRQSSVSPSRSNKRDVPNSRKPIWNGLSKNQRFISNSTSSIHETIRIGGQAHDKRNMSKSTQLLNIAPAHIKGKPPISPGRGGPPPTNKSISSKRLSPIIGTPSKSPIEDKPNSARTPTKPSLGARKPMKTVNNTTTTRLNTRQPNKPLSREPSPDKRKTAPKSSITRLSNNSAKTKPVVRAASTRAAQKPAIPPKAEPKKPINRTSSMKSLTRTPSTKALNEKPTLTKKDSAKNLKATSMTKINETGLKKDTAKDDVKKTPKREINKKGTADKTVNVKAKESKKEDTKPATTTESGTGSEEVSTQDNETQYDKVTNEKGELVILTKKNVVSMTTAAITSQPLEVVTKVTNQLPASLEKAREKGIFERHSSKDSLAPKDDDADLSKDKTEDGKNEDKKQAKTKSNAEMKPIFEDNVKLKPLLPPYNNPQVERVKQKIDDILKSPEVSTENIVALSSAAKVREAKNTFKNIADKTKNEIKEQKAEAMSKLSEISMQIAKESHKVESDLRSEATKIVDSIMTPVEQPKEIEKPKEDIKKAIEPIVTVVNEKKTKPSKHEIMEKMTETLVKGEPDLEVQSSNMSTPKLDKMAVQNKMADTSGSEKSQSNGGFPQSTSTTPKPPARTKKDQKDQSTNGSKGTNETGQSKPPNICQRLMGKCKSRCCPYCIKGEDDDEKETKDVEAPVEKKGVLSRLNCCKKKSLTEKRVQDLERAAGKAASIEFENEVKRKGKLRDVLCGCCGRKRRVSDVSNMAASNMADAPEIAGDTGCCGKRRPVERRDSILSDRPPNSCCNNRLFTWMKGACRRKQPEQISASRRQSLFSKNKSLSPTLPPEEPTLFCEPNPSKFRSNLKPAASPNARNRIIIATGTEFMKKDTDVDEIVEDTRTKLDSSLVEHTSVMRGAIPVLPSVLAYFCLFCNIIVPGLGTILSGLFCLCFGIPRFGVHDGARHRIGSFVINLLVGCGQLFTVLFCLVGWGWSIWWGVIMVKTARKYKKLKAEAAAEEGEAPPVTANNHTRA